ncbi:hypothetical protein [Longitalea arenae]|uniref:hypothetical protein n=1 Tax=Longitalea arenae TaxID=2812558 RepID=UPI001966D969|nr:hypothetical protein [Longitalea arenae]
MKKHFFTALLAGLLGHIALPAQDKKPVPPAWASDKGWWVVQSNIHTPKQNIVYYYNNEGVLVYKVKVEGKRLDPAKKRIRMQLKQVLEASVLAWEKQHQSHSQPTHPSPVTLVDKN